jgi:hypothetical protein
MRDWGKFVFHHRRDYHTNEVKTDAPSEDNSHSRPGISLRTVWKKPCIGRIRALIRAPMHTIRYNKGYNKPCILFVSDPINRDTRLLIAPS